MNDEAPAPDQPMPMPLDPRYRTVLRIRTAIAAIVLTGAAALGALVVAAATEWDTGAAPIAVALVSLIAIIVLPGRRYRRWSYVERDEALQVAHGLLVRVETVVPFGRVQHIDIARGPIERACGVATLVLHTAGSHNSVVRLPGLAVDAAERMRGGIREHIRRETQ